MALQVATLQREFLIKGKGKTKDIRLPDPHPDMTIPEIVNYYKSKYPEIASSTLDGPKLEEKKAIYSFKTVMGDKG